MDSNTKPAILGLLATFGMIGGSIAAAIAVVYGLQWVFGF